MLEISLLVALARYTYRTAEQKGYPGTLFAAVTVVSWFGCGIAGWVVGMNSDGSGIDDLSLNAIVGYLVGVVIAAVANHAVVSALPEGQPQRNPALDRQRAAEQEEWMYVERRRRGEQPEREDEVVPLTPATTRLPVARPVQGRRADPPRAGRAWQKRW